MFKLKSGVQFIIEIKELIDENRDDLEFFELVQMSKLKPENSKVYVSQGLVDVSALSVSGTAPKRDGEYSYSL